MLLGLRYFVEPSVPGKVLEVFLQLPRHSGDVNNPQFLKRCNILFSDTDSCSWNKQAFGNTALFELHIGGFVWRGIYIWQFGNSPFGKEAKQLWRGEEGENFPWNSREGLCSPSTGGKSPKEPGIQQDRAWAGRPELAQLLSAQLWLRRC